MPSREYHNLLAKALLGKKNARLIDQVNATMDMGSKYFGTKHRRVSGHSQEHIAAIALASGDPLRALAVAELHLALDDLSTKAKKRVK